MDKMIKATKENLNLNQLSIALFLLWLFLFLSILGLPIFDQIVWSKL